jgi:hypothetical protein
VPVLAFGLPHDADRRTSLRRAPGHGDRLQQ